MFKLMSRMQNTVLTVAGIATAGLFGISVSDVKGCAQSSEIHGREVSADQRMKIMRKLQIGSTLSNRNLPGDRIDEIVSDYATSLARAEQEGLDVSDHELGMFLHQQFGGKETYANFRKVMEQRYGLKASELEDYFRDQLLMTKSSRMPLLSTYVTDAEIKQEFHRRRDKMVYDEIEIKASALTLEKDPTEDELKAYFEENSTEQQYQVPEKIVVEYVMVSPDDVAAPEMTEEDLRGHFNLNRDDYKSDEEGVETKPYFEVMDDVRESLEKELRDGAAKAILTQIDDEVLKLENVELLKTFEALKAKNPEAFKLAKSGTSKPFSQRDYRMDDLGYVFSLGSRVFGENPRNYGGVLEAEKGLYIYHIVERQDAKVMDYAEAKPLVEESLKGKRLLEAAQDLAATWKEKVVASTDWGTLELPESMSYQLEETEGLSSQEAGQLEDASVGELVSPLTVGQSVKLLRLKERTSADIKELEEEKDSIRENLQRQKGYQLSSAMAPM
jgi:hypothetical protein